MITTWKTVGQFTEGNSGKPKGSRNKAKIAIERVFLSPLKVLRNTNLSINSNINSNPFSVSAETPLQPNIVD